MILFCRFLSGTVLILFFHFYEVPSRSSFLIFKKCRLDPVFSIFFNKCRLNPDLPFFSSGTFSILFLTTALLTILHSFPYFSTALFFIPFIHFFYRCLLDTVFLFLVYCCRPTFIRGAILFAIFKSWTRKSMDPLPTL